MNLVEVIYPTSAAGQPAKKLSGTELIEQFKMLKLTKSNAIQILALANALTKVSDDAKQYLMTLQCAATGSFTDSVSGLTMQVNEATRTAVTNDRIETLKAEIKKEEELVKKGVRDGRIETSTYNRWTLAK